MFSTNSIKFFTFFALIFSLFSACRFWQNSNSNLASPTPFASEELQSGIPFAAKEPDNFQAEIVVTANGQERKTFIARNGENRRYDYDFGRQNQVTALETDKHYLILPAKKIYAETNAAGNFSASDDWREFLTNQWLNTRTEARFEKLESAGNITKYRVVLDGKNSSEILISVDETLGLPVKQEFYSINGEQRALTFSVELKNFKLETDAAIFSVPKDFRKVPVEEFRRILQSEN